MANNDSMKKTITVAFLLCIVCSVVVSTAAVMLKPLQQNNKDQDRKRNILAAAGLLQEDASVDELFKNVKTRVVDLKTGRFTDAVDAAAYQQLKAAKDPKQSRSLSDDEDVAKISRLENYAVVYLVEREGEIEKVILPVRGYGLWSTLHGFLALEKDLNTVVGLGFFDHGETPGLGGEVDNPLWKALWPGKKVYADDGEVAVHLIKGSVNPDRPGAEYQVDGLAGATLTNRGITNLLAFWMGDLGYQRFLNNLKAGEV